MQPNVIEKLTKLNQDFYNKVGSVWNSDPQYAWEGWSQMLTYLDFKESVSVLDIGCGNARFANFIAQHLAVKEYVGLDFSQTLLDSAYITGLPANKVSLISTDIVHDDWKLLTQAQKFADSKFNLVVLFGLLHHIAGNQNRHDIIKQAVYSLEKNGILIFTTWQFLDVPRLAKRIINPSIIGILQHELENGDYILDWVKKIVSYRYAHYFSGDEIQALCAQNSLRIVQQYESDGRSGKRNRYVICQKM